MKPTKRTVLWIVPVLLIAALYYYFKPNEDASKYVTFAEDMILVEGYPYTFKETFSQYCSKANWSYFQTSKRQDVVEFEGECPIDKENEPVHLQILINEDMSDATIGVMLHNHQKIEPTEKEAFIAEVYEQYIPPSS